MRIEIECEGTNKRETIALTNETLDNSNFVDILIGEEELTIDIEELYVAIRAFVALNDEKKKQKNPVEGFN